MFRSVSSFFCRNRFDFPARFPLGRGIIFTVITCDEASGGRTFRRCVVVGALGTFVMIDVMSCVSGLGSGEMETTILSRGMVERMGG